VDDNDISDAEAQTTENDNLSVEEQMREQLTWLRGEHRRIDQEINALMSIESADMLRIRRMKKVKLSMKDQISYLENQLTPDIIA